jgi:hypothetical protein
MNRDNVGQIALLGIRGQKYVKIFSPSGSEEYGLKLQHFNLRVKYAYSLQYE